MKLKLLALSFVLYALLWLWRDRVKHENIKEQLERDVSLMRSVPFWLVSFTLGMLVERFIVSKMKFGNVHRNVLSIIISSALIFIILVLWSPKELLDSHGCLRTENLLDAVIMDTIANYVIIFMIYPVVYKFLSKKVRAVRAESRRVSRNK